MADRMETIVSLCKRRGFIFPSSEIYGGLANAWDYGPLGVELKNNIKQAWWSRFVHRRNDVVGLDAALLMNPKVWEASGHLQHFTVSSRQRRPSPTWANRWSRRKARRCVPIAGAS